MQAETDMANLSVTYYFNSNSSNEYIHHCIWPGVSHAKYWSPVTSAITHLLLILFSIFFCFMIFTFAFPCCRKLSCLNFLIANKIFQGLKEIFLFSFWWPMVACPNFFFNYFFNLLWFGYLQKRITVPFCMVVHKRNMNFGKIKGSFAFICVQLAYQTS